MRASLTGQSIRFLEVTQTLRPNLFPFSLYAPTVRCVASPSSLAAGPCPTHAYLPPAPPRLIVVLFLQRGADGRFYIKRQEDYYQPQM